MLSKTQIQTMLQLQNGMNVKVNPDWINAGYAYLRAAMIESVEAIDHHGWKWWKAQQKDLPQLQMEMIDIWHFALSDYLIKHSGDIETATQDILSSLNTQDELIFDGKSYNYLNNDLLANLQLMTGLCAAQRFSAKLFMTISEQCELSGESLRQDNGYKDGTYIKVWNGKEDNEHLVQVLDTLDIQASDYSEKIYAGLQARYPN
jgi:hypothetical protein